MKLTDTKPDQHGLIRTIGGDVHFVNRITSIGITEGFGCTIGGACGTRVMDNWGQRMLAMAVVWAVPCGAIWGVIPVISGMFFGPVGTLLVCLLILVYMALTTTYRESHSLKWTARVAGFYVGSALVLACIVYHIAALFM